MSALWTVLDTIISALQLPWYNPLRNILLQWMDKLILGGHDLNYFRVSRAMVDPAERFIQMCLAVVDGTFLIYHSQWRYDPGY